MPLTGDNKHFIDAAPARTPQVWPHPTSQVRGMRCARNFPTPVYHQTVTGSALADLVAFGGGVISFLSPCVLPLVPAYLSVVTGLDVAEVQKRPKGNVGRIAAHTALFVMGFGAVFVTLGLSATFAGHLLNANKVILTRVSGVLVVAMAAFLALSVKVNIPWLQGERRINLNPARLGPMAAPLTGAAFGFGWTPCIGPILASVLAVAASSSDPIRGAVLLASYTAGLGLCFFAAGLAAHRLTATFGWVKRHFAGITLASATVMAIFGGFLIMNDMTAITSALESVLQAVGLGRLIYLG